VKIYEKKQCKGESNKHDEKIRASGMYR